MDVTKLFDFLVSDFVSHPLPYLLLLIMLMFAFCAFLAGLGYRRLARAMGIGVGCAILGALVGGTVAGLVGSRVVGRGEGAGVALLLLFVFVAAGAFVIILLTASVWIIWKREYYAARERKSPTWLATGAASLILILLLVLGQALSIWALSRTTIIGSASSLSNEQLANQAISLPISHYVSEATQELRRRGAAAVPAIIQAVHTVPESSVRQFESSETIGLLELLRVLGDIGGPEAIQELRVWLDREAAPDVRGTAAAALGTAGDRESAARMAQFLRDRSYEWRKQHPRIIHALGQLDAKEELPAIREALTVTPEDGSGFGMDLLRAGAGALSKFDTPESWQCLSELSAGDPKDPQVKWRQDTIRGALREIGRELPTPKESL